MMFIRKPVATPDPVAGRHFRHHALVLGVALATAGLAGCAGSDFLAGTMSDPLKYEFYDCKQLEQTVRSQNTYEVKLRGLIEKAEQGTGGAFVSAMAYKTDYAKVRADLKLLREQQQRKNCITQTESGGIGAVH